MPSEIPIGGSSRMTQREVRSHTAHSVVQSPSSHRDATCSSWPHPPCHAVLKPLKTPVNTSLSCLCQAFWSVMRKLTHTSAQSGQANLVIAEGRQPKVMGGRTQKQTGREGQACPTWPLQNRLRPYCQDKPGPVCPS